MLFQAAVEAAAPVTADLATAALDRAVQAQVVQVVQARVAQAQVVQVVQAQVAQAQVVRAVQVRAVPALAATLVPSQPYHRLAVAAGLVMSTSLSPIRLILAADFTLMRQAN